MLSNQQQSDDTVGARIRHAFREREFYIRSEGTLRYFVVRPWVQVTGVAFCALFALWISVTTLSFVFQEQRIISANNRVQAVRLSYEDRIAAIQDRIDTLNDRLMLDQDGYLEQVDLLRGEFAELVRRHHRIEVFLDQGWMPVGDDDAGVDRTGEGEATNPDDAQQREGFWHRRNVPDFRTAEEADQPLREVRVLFAGLVEQQHGLLDRVVESSNDEAERLRTIIRRLGLDPAKVVGSIDSVPNALGGPLLPVQQGEAPQDGLDERILEAHSRFDEAEKLRYAVSKMPIRLPIVSGYRLTSGFGFRHDPFTDLLAMHSGVDLKAAEGTPVVATANGRIVRAEHGDAYGKVIDIRHDNGITTRYAHLSEIAVESGDRVEAGQRIGRVGSTGRSTGPHLHYEARVDDRPIDPYQFLRVARDVLQQEN